MRRKFPCLIVATAILASSVLSGCELMPVEEEPPAVPIVNEYSGPGYEQVTVLRGDLVLKRDISCVYSATVSDNYAFPMELEGTKIAAVYVTLGQAVTKGTLLAELDNESLYNQISTQKGKIDDQKLKIVHMEEDRDLDLRLQNALIEQYRSQLQKTQAEIDALTAWEADPSAGPKPTNTTMDKLQKQAQNLQQNLDKQIANKTSVSDNYETRLVNAENSLLILQQRMEELQASLATRQLVAQMDGVVTHADSVVQEPKVKNRTTVTVTNMDSVSFQVKTQKDVAVLTVGMEVQMKIGNSMYPAVVTEKVPVAPDSTEEVAHLQLTANDAPEIRIGYTAVITMIEASRTGVLYVDAKTVKSNAEGNYVNVIGSDGLKTKKNVTVGITCDNMTEIIEGLAEGDKVIKE